MIKIKVIGSGKNFSMLEVKGHANSAEYGKDLVCASVSSIITGGFNSIRDKENFHFELKEGYACLKAINTISEYDEAVINTIITSLQTIEEADSSFVKVTKM